MRLAAVVCLAGSICAVCGQPTAVAPTYEVASIKPNRSGENLTTVRPDVRGRLHAQNASLALLIQYAWRIEPSRIVGASGWIASERYDIEAKAPQREAYYTFDEIGHMLQALLNERFRLAAHIEKRELPVYLLRVAKSGVKMKRSEGQNCFQPNLAGKPEDAHGLPQCGGLYVQRGSLRGDKVTMPLLAVQIGRLVDRPVVDETGLDGESDQYDLEMRWIPFDPAPGTAAENNPDASGPSIFTALPEQLGLKLEAGKAPIEVLAIDRAERPTEN